MAHQQEHEFILQDDLADDAQFLPMVGAAPLIFTVDEAGRITGLSCRLDAAVEPIEFVRD